MASQFTFMEAETMKGRCQSCGKMGCQAHTGKAMPKGSGAGKPPFKAKAK